MINWRDWQTGIDISALAAIVGKNHLPQYPQVDARVTGLIGSLRTSIAGGLKDRVFYGWVIVFIAALGLFSSGPGQSHTFSVFYELIAQDLGYSLTDVTWAYGFATVLAAFILPFMGRYVDMFGPRRSLIVIVILLGAACFLFGAVASYLWLVVGFGLLRFLGQGSMMLGSANIVAQWFTAKRGLAMSLMAFGFGLSIAVHPKLGQWLIDLYGWRTAWHVLGVLTWVQMLPVLLLFAWDRPSQLGLMPDGEKPVEGQAPPELTGPTLQEALVHRSFWLLCACWFGFAALVTTQHYHQVNILTTQGLDSSWATNSFVVTSISMMAFMPLVGRGCDKFRTRYMLAAGMVVMSLALVAMTFVRDVPTMFVYAIIFGLNNSFMMTLFGYLWPRYFGRKHLGRIQGTGQLITVIGASLGPIPVSLAFDGSGDPTNTLLLLAIYPVVVAVLAVIFLKTHPAVEGTTHLE